MLTVGEILRNAREKQNITLEAVEKRIRVRQKYLRALEENNWDFFPSKIYITGVIKNYSQLLGLNTSNILAFFRRDYEKKEEVKFKKRVSSTHLAPQTRRIALIFVLLVFLFFIGYFGYQVSQYFLPPSVEIIAPKSTTFKKEERIQIVGKTEKEATINIFGERIFPDKEGIFEYTFPLVVGKNKLIVEVIGASGKKSTFEKEYIRER